MYGHYGYYGVDSEAEVAVAGAAGAAVSAEGDDHKDPGGFMGLNWSSILVAVAIGSVTAVITSLTIEYVKDRRKVGKPQQHVLMLTDKP